MKKLDRTYRGLDDKFVETVRQKRHEAEKRLAVLTLQAPRGHQTDLVIGFSVWQIANEVLQKYQKQNWSMVADLVSEHFPVKPGWDADAARKTYERFWGMITNSAKGDNLL